MWFMDRIDWITLVALWKSMKITNGFNEEKFIQLDHASIKFLDLMIPQLKWILDFCQKIKNLSENWFRKLFAFFQNKNDAIQNIDDRIKAKNDSKIKWSLSTRFEFSKWISKSNQI